MGSTNIKEHNIKKFKITIRTITTHLSTNE